MCSFEESNLRPSGYSFGCSTTELEETRGSRGHKTTEFHGTNILHTAMI